MKTLGIFLLLTGGFLMLLGLLLLIFPQGVLPGDIVLRKGKVTIIFPLGLSLLLSLLGTLLLNLLLRR